MVQKGLNPPVCDSIRRFVTSDVCESMNDPGSWELAAARLSRGRESCGPRLCVKQGRIDRPDCTWTRIPGHWPYLGPDELAETEPVFARTRDVFLSFTPPRARAGQARPAWPHLDFSMSPLRSALCRLAPASTTPYSCCCSVLHEPLVVRRKAARGLEA